MNAMIFIALLVAPLQSLTAAAEVDAEGHQLVGTKKCTSAKVPEQVHLALQGRDSEGNPTGMNVGWYTEDDALSEVAYGLEAGSMNMTAAGTRQQYLKGYGYHHSVDLKDLRPSTTYYYQPVGSPETFSFKSAPGSAKFLPFSVSVWGDMGYLGSKERPMIITEGGLLKNWSAVPTRKTLEKLYNDKKIDMVWHLGDIGYADDAFAHDLVGALYEDCYNGYMNWMQNISSAVPYHVSVGNHESECHSPTCVSDPFIGLQLANFSAYNARWNMPSSSSGGVQSMWYSWNYGPIHFVSLNSETDFPGAGEEHRGDSGIFPAGKFAPEGTYMQWLEADLKQAHEARKGGLPGARRWIVAGAHRPCCEDIPGVQELFDKYEVDLYVSGHEHTYARSYKKCEPPACKSASQSLYPTTFVYCGGTGSEETPYNTTPGLSPRPGAVKFQTDELSSGLLSVVDESTLRWQLISSLDGRVIDSLDISN